MFMILFNLLKVFCFDEFKVEIFLCEPDTTVPFTNKLIMQARVLHYYVSGYLLKEVSLQKILEMNAIDNFKSVCHEVSELYSNNILLLKQMRKRKMNIENKIIKTKSAQFFRYFNTQLKYENTQIKEIETIQECLVKLKIDLEKLNNQILNPLKTICTESQLQRMKSEAEKNIEFLLEMYEAQIKDCTKI